MSDSSPLLEPPAWVYKRDGRLVPFEADKISQALFAATEELGKPDAFLARELTDGIVHFLAAETEGTVPTTAQVADLTTKLVRELGQPALAQVFSQSLKQPSKSRETVAPASEVSLHFSLDDAPSAAARAALRSYSLHGIYSRDLVAAQRDGLLTLTGLETPLELAGGVLHGISATKTDRPLLIEAMEEARLIIGDFLALDGPEHALACQTGAAEQSRQLDAWVRELAIGLRATSLRAVVNLNSRTPPAWADHLAQGPLFADWQEARDPQRPAELADALLHELLTTFTHDSRPGTPGGPLPTGHTGAMPLRIDWHLGEQDFRPAGEKRLAWVADRVASGGPIAFTFDRPRRDIALAEGMDRRHPAVLLTVGVHLPCLARQVLKSSGRLEISGESALGAGLPTSALDASLSTPPPTDDKSERAGSSGVELFLQKLGTLARLALSAGVQKREFLRRRSGDRPAMTGGFLLERARLVVAPVGLEETVNAFVGWRAGGVSPLMRGEKSEARGEITDHSSTAHSSLTPSPSSLTSGAGLELARRIVQRLRDVLREDGGRCQLDAVLDGALVHSALAHSALVSHPFSLVPHKSGECQPPDDPDSWDWAAPVKSQLRAGAALHNVTGTGTLTVLVPSDQEWNGRQVFDWLRQAWQHPDLVRLRFVRREEQTQQRPLVL